MAHITRKGVKLKLRLCDLHFKSNVSMKLLFCFRLFLPAFDVKSSQVCFSLLRGISKLVKLKLFPIMQNIVMKQPH